MPTLQPHYLNYPLQSWQHESNLKEDALSLSFTNEQFAIEFFARFVVEGRLKFYVTYNTNARV